MPTLFRLLLLLALLLFGQASLRAQSLTASAPPVATPDSVATSAAPAAPSDPRYAQAAELTELKNQFQTLLQAYGQLVTRYNDQNVKLQQLEQQATPAVPARTSRPRANSWANSY